MANIKVDMSKVEEILAKNSLTDFGMQFKLNSGLSEMLRKSLDVGKLIAESYDENNEFMKFLEELGVITKVATADDVWACIQHVVETADTSPTGFNVGGHSRPAVIKLELGRLKAVMKNYFNNVECKSSSKPGSAHWVNSECLIINSSNTDRILDILTECIMRDSYKVEDMIMNGTTGLANMDDADLMNEIDDAHLMDEAIEVGAINFEADTFLDMIGSWINYVTQDETDEYLSQLVNILRITEPFRKDFKELDK